MVTRYYLRMHGMYTYLADRDRSCGWWRGVKWSGGAGEGLLLLSRSPGATWSLSGVVLYIRLKSSLGEGSSPSFGLCLLLKVLYKVADLKLEVAAPGMCDWVRRRRGGFSGGYGRREVKSGRKSLISAKYQSYCKQ